MFRYDLHFSDIKLGVGGERLNFIGLIYLSYDFLAQSDSESYPGNITVDVSSIGLKYALSTAPIQHSFTTIVGSIKIAWKSESQCSCVKRLQTSLEIEKVKPKVS